MHLISRDLIRSRFPLVDIGGHIGGGCLVQELVKRCVMWGVNHMVGGQHITMCANKRTCARIFQWVSIATRAIRLGEGHNIRRRKMHGEVPTEGGEYTHYCWFGNINCTHHGIVHIASRTTGRKNCLSCSGANNGETHKAYYQQKTEKWVT